MVNMVNVTPLYQHSPELQNIEQNLHIFLEIAIIRITI